MASIHYRLAMRVTAFVGLSVVCALIAGPIGHSQEKFPRPPNPVKEGIVLHIDGPDTVNQKLCGEYSFVIKYTVFSNTTEPANGTVQARFMGAQLKPVGSAKLNNLLPGHSASGGFTACCPGNVGVQKVFMEYHDKPYKNPAVPTIMYQINEYDSHDISCTVIL